MVINNFSVKQIDMNMFTKKENVPLIVFPPH